VLFHLTDGSTTVDPEMAEEHLKHFAVIQFFRNFTEIEINLAVSQTQQIFFISTNSCVFHLIR
jgi:hypothetical protein